MNKNRENGKWKDNKFKKSVLVYEVAEAEGSENGSGGTKGSENGVMLVLKDLIEKASVLPCNFELIPLIVSKYQHIHAWLTHPKLVYLLKQAQVAGSERQAQVERRCERHDLQTLALTDGPEQQYTYPHHLCPVPHTQTLQTHAEGEESENRDSSLWSHDGCLHCSGKTSVIHIYIYIYIYVSMRNTHIYPFGTV